MPPAPSASGGAAPPPSKLQSPLRITHNGEFYARLLTRESFSSLSNPSFRYYGAGPASCPSCGSRSRACPRTPTPPPG